MTDIEYQRWLRSLHNERCLLIALQNSGETVYLSSRAYTSRPDDTLSNIPFRECLTASPELTDSDSLEIGDLEFLWPEKVAELRARHWRGHGFTIWLGSPAWRFDDFRQIHTGFIDSVSRSSKDCLTVDFASAGIALQQSVADTIENDVRLPHSLGSVRNVSPQLVKSAVLSGYEYAVHDGPVDSVTVRIDGKPDIEHVVPNYTINLSTGRIVFAVEPTGTITADVTVNSSTTFKHAVELLAARRGIPPPVFDYFSDDLLNAAIGYYINDESEYESVLDDLAESVGAFITHDSAGVMHVVYLDHQRSADLTAIDDDILLSSISEKGELKELSDITLRYAKNHTVQADSADYLTEWQTLTEKNTDNHYPAGWRESVILDTHFSTITDVTAAAQSLKDWRFVRRIRYEMTLFLRGAELRRGARLGIESHSWGLSVTGTVMSIERQPDSNRYVVEVIV